MQREASGLQTRSENTAWASGLRHAASGSGERKWLAKAACRSGVSKRRAKAAAVVDKSAWLLAYFTIRSACESGLRRRLAEAACESGSQKRLAKAARESGSRKRLAIGGVKYCGVVARELRARLNEVVNAGEQHICVEAGKLAVERTQWPRGRRLAALR